MVNKYKIHYKIYVLVFLRLIFSLKRGKNRMLMLEIPYKVMLKYCKISHI